ncbi:hypothetical protein L3X38_008930 [Prunus dulcis]|uniref:Uncharacterized protein n=1 Tax=Prunus dulcis TaxID=3755 RepID=A0AAD4ZXE1_PRUDU|nr:hypothetical protein L3X38_008930 [Prunus dulcis]
MLRTWKDMQVLGFMTACPNPTKKPREKEAHVECLKEKKLFKDTAAKLKADHEKAFGNDNGEFGDKSHIVTAQEMEAIILTRSQVIYLSYH